MAFAYAVFAQFLSLEVAALLEKKMIANCQRKMLHQNIRLDRVLSDSGQHFGIEPKLESPSSLVLMFLLREMPHQNRSTLFGLSPIKN